MTNSGRFITEVNHEQTHDRYQSQSVDHFYTDSFRIIWLFIDVLYEMDFLMKIKMNNIFLPNLNF